MANNATSAVSEGLKSTGDESLMQLVGVPVVGGLIFFSLVTLFFGLAIQNGWTDDLAPRVANRPKQVVKNAMLYHCKENSWATSKFWYPVAWITWAYKLTYKECLLGIPGTGTRKNGWEGPLLKTNLDAVILMKFHGFLFKVAVLAAFLFTFVVLPLYLTTPCDVEVLGAGTCLARDRTASSLFLKTTLANIPLPLSNNDTSTEFVATFDTSNLFLFNGDKNISVNVDDSNATVGNGIAGNITSSKGEGQLVFYYLPSLYVRACIIIVCCILIYVYTLALLALEWPANVALRRKFFLEMTHYSHRMLELNKQVEYDDVIEREKCSEDDDCEDDDANRIQDLPSYLTHPEIRETPPSVGVYSVLYQLPESMLTYDTGGATTIERQLVASRNFFDEIIPPQEGFSSSVAAVTILPNARLVAKARSKWAACESKILVLRYIRKQIQLREQEKERYEQQFENQEPSVPVHSDGYGDGSGRYNRDEAIEGSESSYPSSSRRKKDHIAMRTAPDGSVQSISSSEEEEKHTITNPESNHVVEPLAPRKTFTYEDFNVFEYARQLGFREEVDDLGDFVDGMGIEEFNVFAYECALLAGGPGFNKRVYQLYSLETLREEESQLVGELEKAKAELNEARKAVAVKSDDTEVAPGGPSSLPVLDHQDEVENIADDGFNMDAGHGHLGIRRRRTTTSSQFDFIDIETNMTDSEKKTTNQPASIGCIRLSINFLSRIFLGVERNDYGIPKYYGIESEEGKGKGYVTNLERPSYAVVTFTNRYAAIIARQCLADGSSGSNGWKQVDDIPNYPLADAPPFSPLVFSRPITLNISYFAKKVRRWFVCTLLVIFTVANTYIVNKINSLVFNPNTVANLFNIKLDKAIRIVSPVTGLSQTLLFSISPTIFRFLSNLEGSSSSVGHSEQKSIIYFWYFFIIARFIGQIIVDAFMKVVIGSGDGAGSGSGGGGDGDRLSTEEVFNQGVTELSRVPLTLGPSAIAFIIVSFFITWPVTYFVPLANFATSFFRLRWFNRILKGGGSGSEVPYRIYVDHGYVFACMLVLGPFCPLIGPFALLYFIVLAPMIRWVLVFQYRPQFDGGGDKWPKLHHIIISSLLLSQCIAAVVFIANFLILPGIIVGSCIVPTLLYNHVILDKYLRPYKDAALLQTGRLFKDTSENRTRLEREEYRRWLVDCHKASYVPTCLSGEGKNVLTAEPAVVVSSDGDDEDAIVADNIKSIRNLFERQKAQKGGILHRQRYNL